MKVLVATRRGQGERPGDFTWVPEGELVFPGFVCDTDRLNPEGGCGCGRALAGVESAKATTTAEVVERDLTFEQLQEIIANALLRQGWGRDDELAESIADDIEGACEDLPVGTVVGRRLDELFAR
ncbi:DUF7715 family protein [Micromonospora maritima]|uniref:DUF7715 family protein n=1 Tax=Micromonospora maritima TaxID=986711 RepID=UPI00157CE8C6|nr:hypothetical protein [Micromonospora maritima]